MSDKAPIRIIYFNDRISTAIDLHDSILIDNIQDKIAQFEINYKKLISDIHSTRKQIDELKKNKAPKYWEISNMINILYNDIDDDLDVINWHESIIRECSDIKGIGRANAGVLKDFAIFFNKNEVYENVSWSHYWEFTLKSRKLQQVGIFDDVKADFLRRGRNNELPPHKDLRKELAQKIQLKAK